jgi:hypothetical protein
VIEKEEKSVVPNSYLQLEEKSDLDQHAINHGVAPPPSTCWIFTTSGSHSPQESTPSRP